MSADRSGAAVLFDSYWQAGYEGADHRNGSAVPLSLAESSGHMAHLDRDYEALSAFGIRTVRESAGWRRCEISHNEFDFQHVRLRAEAARRHNLQLLWTCC